MPRKKTEICIKCNINSTQDGRYCNSCRNKNRSSYFKKRYVDNGGYRNHRIKTKEFRIKEKILEIFNNSCNKCGWNKENEILQIHHKDRNQKNNLIENLELLCPTCHHYHHFLESTGFYTKDRSKFLLNKYANTVLSSEITKGSETV